MRISDWSSDVCSSDLRSIASPSAARSNRCSAAIMSRDVNRSSPFPSRPSATSSGEDRTALITRSEEHTSELQSLMRISYAVFCLKKKKRNNEMIKTYIEYITHNLLSTRFSPDNNIYNYITITDVH